jgi:hypothetical protein
MGQRKKLEGPTYEYISAIWEWCRIILICHQVEFSFDIISQMKILCRVAKSCFNLCKISLMDHRRETPETEIGVAPPAERNVVSGSGRMATVA